MTDVTAATLFLLQNMDGVMETSETNSKSDENDFYHVYYAYIISYYIIIKLYYA